MLILPIAVPTNSTEPTGGVIRPMPAFRISMTPNCSGLTPNAVATGKKIGVQMMISGAMSMNVPSTSSTTFIASKIASGSSATRAHRGHDLRGHLEYASNQPNAAAALITNRMMPAVCAALEHAASKLAPPEAPIHERRDDDRVKHRDGRALDGREDARADAAENHEHEQQSRQRRDETRAPRCARRGTRLSA